jgi:competence protein ComEA
VRGETGRVAARVRDLLSSYAEPGFDEDAADVGPAPFLAQPARAPRATLWQRVMMRVPIRLDPGRRAALAIGLAVLVAAVVTGLWLLADRPQSVALPATDPQIPGASSPVGTDEPIAPTSVASASSVSASLAVVDVAGKVRHPGLYRLPAGSRVDDAVKAAGGPLAGIDLTSLNLAAKVVDGQQILVGIPGGPGVLPAAGAPDAVPDAGGVSGSGPVNLNVATLEQLEALPGVGPVLGQQILDWRTAHGSFSSVDQLNDVSGIGEVKYATLRPLVTV